MKYLLMLSAFALLLPVSGLATEFPLKEGQTLYTKEARDQAAEQIAHADWAVKRRDAILREADRWRDFTDEEIAALVPPPSLPRAAYVHANGSPVIGREVYSKGTYPWITSLEKPWKVTCPITGAVFPSNDFAAFLKSSGKNRELLTGPYADDGWGWKETKDSKEHYWFVAYYVSWELIMNNVIPALKALPEAYLLTGEERYARQAAILLWKLSEYYPEYDYQTQSRYGTEVAPGGYKGKLLYHTWEALHTVPACAKAYDAIWPYLKDRYDLKPFTGLDSEEIRRQIESQLLHEMLRLIVQPEPWIVGNYAMHQKAAILLLKVLHRGITQPSFDEGRTWLLENKAPGHAAAMGVDDALYNLVYRDGIPVENFGYNLGWLRKLADLAVDIKGLNIGYDLQSNSRFKRLWDWPSGVTALEEFTQAMGDGSDYRAAPIDRRPDLLASEVQLFGSARAAYRLIQTGWAATASAGAGGSLGDALFFEKPITAGQVEALAREYRPTPHPVPQVFPAFGYAILQSANENGKTAAALSFGNPLWHGHADQLNLEIFSPEGSWNPDLGYPETANADDPRRFGYFSHTVSHNTVMVDGTNQLRTRPGQLIAFDNAPGIQSLRAKGAAYPGLETYERGIYLLDRKDGSPYLIDLFRVKGGKQHDWIMHFAPGRLIKQGKWEALPGTLAGKDVKFGEFYDAPAQLIAKKTYSLYKGSGFQFLRNVERLRPASKKGVAHYLSLERASSLVKDGTSKTFRVYRVPLSKEALFHAKGDLQARFKEQIPEIDYLVRRSHPEASSGESLFLTVYEVTEAGAQELVITPQFEATTGSVSLRIEHPDGSEHLFFEAGVDQKIWKANGIVWSGRAAFIARDRDGRVENAWGSGSRFDGGHSFLKEARRDYKVASVRFEPAEIHLTSEFEDGEGKILGGSDLYRSLFHAQPAGSILSLPDQDLRAGRVTVRSHQGRTLTVSQFPLTATPGMSLLTPSGGLVGKIVEMNAMQRTISLDRNIPSGNLTSEGFFWISAIGPGDTLHSLKGHSAASLAKSAD